jgi:integrase
MVNGKRHHVYGKTEKEVDREIRKLVAKAERGEVPASGQWTVGKYLEHWLENVIGPNRRATTYRDYRNTIYKHAIPEFGRVRLTKLEPHHLEKLYAGMRTKGLAAKTIKNAHGTVHTALQHALRQGVVVRNVAEAVDPPKAGRTEIHVFTPEQARSLRDVIAGSRWEAIIALAMASGMRQGELLGLRWRDVDLDARRVHVSRQLDRDKNLTETKTAKGRRVIDLPAFVVESLRSHRARQLEHKLLAGPDWEERDLVFTTYAGRPLMARNVIREYAKVLVRAGLPHVEFHGLRHTAATLMLVQGVPAKVVQEMLGHSQISVTLDTYSHVMPGMGRDAASRMQDLFV